MRSGRAGPGRRFWHTRSGRENVRPLDDHPARGTLPMYKRQGRRRFPVTEVIRTTVSAGRPATSAFLPAWVGLLSQANGQSVSGLPAGGGSAGREIALAPNRHIHLGSNGPCA